VSPERPRRKKASNFSSVPPEGFVAPDAAMGMMQQMAALSGGMMPMGGGAMPGMGGMPGMGMPGMPGMPPMMGMPAASGNLDQSTKTLRELFVGNTPENTQEGPLMGFLNQALQQVNLCTAPGNPIIQCRVSQKFAFIELRSIEEANACLNITGIPFGGNMLKIGRPSKYTGPMVQTSSWQQLTGAVLDPSATDPNTKVFRELFIGNTSEGMSEVDLQEFLGAAMAQVGLTTKPGNPILTTRLSGKFAFVEMRSIEETNAALNMNGIPYMGMNLRVGRPSKYSGPQVPHLEWNELLAKFMAGELQPLAPAAPPTTVIRLDKMVTVADVASDEDHKEILEDTAEECGKYGAVTSVVIPRDGAPGSGLVFVAFAEAAQAAAASAALAGRTFDGRSVAAAFYDEARFAAGDFSG